MLKNILLVMAILLLCPFVAASDSLELSGIQKLSMTDRKLAIKAWAKMKHTLPGLDEYAQDLKVADVSKSQAVKGLTFLVVVADPTKVIPKAYMANGHNCYIDVDARLKNVSISKRACISLATMLNAFDPALTASLKGGPLVLKLD